MITPILITKQNCQKCDWLKAQNISFANITMVDANTIDGMSILAYYEKLETNKFPMLVTADEQILTEAIPIKQYIDMYNIHKVIL